MIMLYSDLQDTADEKYLSSFVKLEFFFVVPSETRRVVSAGNGGMRMVNGTATERRQG